MSDNEKYVVIIEHKSEEPLVMEQCVRTVTYEEVSKRRDSLLKDPNIIRVAIARLVFTDGNESLLPDSNYAGGF